MAISDLQKKTVENYFVAHIEPGWELKKTQWVEPTRVGPKQARHQVIFTIENTEVKKGKRCSYNGKRLLKEAEAFYGRAN